jgi:hypothetical protein
MVVGADFALQSSKAQDYPLTPMSLVPVGDHSRIMLVCKVAAGRQKDTTENMPTQQGAPAGFDSVCGRPPQNPTGSDLRYDELVVYKEEAVLPYAIVKYNYQKVKVTKVIGTGVPGPGPSILDPGNLPPGAQHVPGRSRHMSKRAVDTQTLTVREAQRQCVARGGAGFSFHSPHPNPPGPAACQFFSIAQTATSPQPADYVSSAKMCQWMACRCQWQSYIVVDVAAEARRLEKARKLEEAQLLQESGLTYHDGAISSGGNVCCEDPITVRDALHRTIVDSRVLGFTFDRKQLAGPLTLDTQLRHVFFKNKTTRAYGAGWESWGMYVVETEAKSGGASDATGPLLPPGTQQGAEGVALVFTAQNTQDAYGGSASAMATTGGASLKTAEAQSKLAAYQKVESERRKAITGGATVETAGYGDGRLQSMFAYRRGTIVSGGDVVFAAVRNITVREAMARAEADSKLLGFTFNQAAFVAGALSLDTELPQVFFIPEKTKKGLLYEKTKIPQTNDPIFRCWGTYLKQGAVGVDLSAKTGTQKSAGGVSAQDRRLQTVFAYRKGAITRGADVKCGDDTGGFRTVPGKGFCATNITVREAMRRAETDTRVLGFTFSERGVGSALSLDTMLPQVFFKSKTTNASADESDGWAMYVKG